MSGFIKRSILVVIVAIILLTTIILPVSAVDSTYEFNIPDPIPNGANGYIVLPFSYSSSYIPAECIWWTITPLWDVTSNSLPNVECDLTSSKLKLDFEFFDTTGYYMLSIYTIWNGSDNDNYIRVTDKVISYNSSYSYTIDFPVEDYPSGQFLKPSYFGGLTSFRNSASTSGFSYNVVWANESPIFNTLSNINTNISSLLSNYISKTDLTNSKLDTLVTNINTVINHFVTLLSKVDYTNEQLDTIVSQFTELLEVSWSICGTLDDFVYYYWDEFATYTFPSQISEICTRLDLILKALNRKGDVEQTTVNSDKVDEYADIEQSLLNNEEAKSAISDFDIAIDGQSYSFIWELVTRIFNSHPEVFGLVITILTLGFLALILNR